MNFIKNVFLTIGDFFLIMKDVGEVLVDKDEPLGEKAGLLVGVLASPPFMFIYLVAVVILGLLIK